MREYRQNLQKEHFADKKQNCKTNPEIAHLSQKSATDFSQTNYYAKSSQKCYKIKYKFYTASRVMIYLIVVIFALMFSLTHLQINRDNNIDVNAAVDGVKIYVHVDKNIYTNFSVNFAGKEVSAEYVSDGYWYALVTVQSASGILILPDAPSVYKWKNQDDGTIYSASNVNVAVVALDSYDGYGCIRIELVQDTVAPTLSVTGSVECDNSMMLLTIVKNDNNAVVQEIGFVTGQTNVTMSGIALETNTTYKVLVTKPFGSVVEVVGATQTYPTVYTFSTGSNATLALTFTLSGNGRWSNTVVV